MLRFSGASGRNGGYCGWTEKFEVWILLSAMPDIFSVANTRFMAVVLAESAAAAVGAGGSTPADSRAISGLPEISPSPVTLMVRENKGFSAAHAGAAAKMAAPAK